MASRIVTDYSSGLAGLGLPGVTVVAPEAEKRRFGDPAGRAAYLAAYLEAVKAGPTPVIALVGPYGYSPAQTAASGARNDVVSEFAAAEHVRVLDREIAREECVEPIEHVWGRSSEVET